MVGLTRYDRINSEKLKENNHKFLTIKNVR